MKVHEVMTKSPAYCRSDASLGGAARIMWNLNCGFLPILNSQHEVVGVITDRDMCMAMATHNRLPGDITVCQVLSGIIYSCMYDEDISVALEMMEVKGVRRLLVIDASGKLAGILSVDDLLDKLDSSQLGITQRKAASA